MNLLISLLKKLNVVPAPLLDVYPAICGARALLEANRLDVFLALNRNPRGLNPGELARQTGLSEEGARILLEALCKFGYLRCRRGRYTNGRWVRRWILSPECGLSNFLRLQGHLWKRLADLEIPLRTGRPVMDYHQTETALPSEKQEIYTAAMLEVARLLIPSFLKQVKIPPQARTVLDLGGAHGEYARALVCRYPRLKATILDLPGPLATARRNIEQGGNPEGIQLREGDMLNDELGGGWDVILVINTIHLFNPGQNQELFKRIQKSLSPGGVVIILDQFLGAGRIPDSVAALISLAFFTVGGRVYGLQEIRRLLRESGFSRVRAKPFRLRAPAALIEGWK